MNKKEAKGFEAQAKELTPRGTPYRYFNHEFPPEEWVKVTDVQAEVLRRKEQMRVRERKESD